MLPSKETLQLWLTADQAPVIGWIGSFREGKGVLDIRYHES